MNGTITVRTSVEEHRKIKAAAWMQGKSLNEFCVEALKLRTQAVIEACPESYERVAKIMQEAASDA